MPRSSAGISVLSDSTESSIHGSILGPNSSFSPNLSFEKESILHNDSNVSLRELRQLSFTERLRESDVSLVFPRGSLNELKSKKRKRKPTDTSMNTDGREKDNESIKISDESSVSINISSIDDSFFKKPKEPPPKNKSPFVSAERKVHSRKVSLDFNPSENTPDQKKKNIKKSPKTKKSFTIKKVPLRKVSINIQSDSSSESIEDGVTNSPHFPLINNVNEKLSRRKVSIKLLDVSPNDSVKGNDSNSTCTNSFSELTDSFENEEYICDQKLSSQSQGSYKSIRNSGSKQEEVYSRKVSVNFTLDDSISEGNTDKSKTEDNFERDSSSTTENGVKKSNKKSFKNKTDSNVTEDSAISNQNSTLRRSKRTHNADNINHSSEITDLESKNNLSSRKLLYTNTKSKNNEECSTNSDKERNNLVSNKSVLPLEVAKSEFKNIKEKPRKSILRRSARNSGCRVSFNDDKGLKDTSLEIIGRLRSRISSVLKPLQEECDKEQLKTDELELSKSINCPENNSLFTESVPRISTLIGDETMDLTHCAKDIKTVTSRKVSVGFTLNTSDSIDCTSPILTKSSNITMKSVNNTAVSMCLDESLPLSANDQSKLIQNEFQDKDEEIEKNKGRRRVSVHFALEDCESKCDSTTSQDLCDKSEIREQEKNQIYASEQLVVDASIIDNTKRDSSKKEIVNDLEEKDEPLCCESELNYNSEVDNSCVIDSGNRKDLDVSRLCVINSLKSKKISLQIKDSANSTNEQTLNDSLLQAMNVYMKKIKQKRSLSVGSVMQGLHYDSYVKDEESNDQTIDVSKTNISEHFEISGFKETHSFVNSTLKDPSQLISNHISQKHFNSSYVNSCLTEENPGQSEINLQKELDLEGNRLSIQVSFDDSEVDRALQDVHSKTLDSISKTTKDNMEVTNVDKLVFCKKGLKEYCDENNKNNDSAMQSLHCATSNGDFYKTQLNFTNEQSCEKGEHGSNLSEMGKSHDGKPPLNQTNLKNNESSNEKDSSINETNIITSASIELKKSEISDHSLSNITVSKSIPSESKEPVTAKRVSVHFDLEESNISDQNSESSLNFSRGLIYTKSDDTKLSITKDTCDVSNVDLTDFSRNNTFSESKASEINESKLKAKKNVSVNFALDDASSFTDSSTLTSFTNFTEKNPGHSEIILQQQSQPAITREEITKNRLSVHISFDDLEADRALQDANSKKSDSNFIADLSNCNDTLVSNETCLKDTHVSCEEKYSTLTSLHTATSTGDLETEYNLSNEKSCTEIKEHINHFPGNELPITSDTTKVNEFPSTNVEIMSAPLGPASNTSGEHDTNLPSLKNLSIVTESIITEVQDNSTNENCSKDNSTNENCSKDNSTNENCSKDNSTNENCSKDNSTNENCSKDNSTNENCSKDNSTNENFSKDNSTNENCSKDNSTNENCSNIEEHGKTVSKIDTMSSEFNSNDPKNMSLTISSRMLNSEYDRCEQFDKVSPNNVSVHFQLNSTCGSMQDTIKSATYSGEDSSSEKNIRHKDSVKNSNVSVIESDNGPQDSPSHQLSLCESVSIGDASNIQKSCYDKISDIRDQKNLDKHIDAEDREVNVSESCLPFSSSRSKFKAGDENIDVCDHSKFEVSRMSLNEINSSLKGDEAMNKNCKKGESSNEKDLSRNETNITSASIELKKSEISDNSLSNITVSKSIPSEAKELVTTAKRVSVHFDPEESNMSDQNSESSLNFSRLSPSVDLIYPNMDDSKFSITKDTCDVSNVDLTDFSRNNTLPESKTSEHNNSKLKAKKNVSVNFALENASSFTDSSTFTSFTNFTEENPGHSEIISQQKSLLATTKGDMTKNRLSVHILFDDSNMDRTLHDTHSKGSESISNSVMDNADVSKFDGTLVCSETCLKDSHVNRKEIDSTLPSLSISTLDDVCARSFNLNNKEKCGKINDHESKFSFNEQSLTLDSTNENEVHSTNLIKESVSLNQASIIPKENEAVDLPSSRNSSSITRSTIPEEKYNSTNLNCSTIEGNKNSSEKSENMSLTISSGTLNPGNDKFNIVKFPENNVSVHFQLNSNDESNLNESTRNTESDVNFCSDKLVKPKVSIKLSDISSNDSDAPQESLSLHLSLENSENEGDDNNIIQKSCNENISGIREQENPLKHSSFEPTVGNIAKTSKSLMENNSILLKASNFAGVLEDGGKEIQDDEKHCKSSTNVISDSNHSCIVNKNTEVNDCALDISLPHTLDVEDMVDSQLVTSSRDKNKKLSSQINNRAATEKENIEVCRLSDTEQKTLKSIALEKSEILNDSASNKTFNVKGYLTGKRVSIDFPLEKLENGEQNYECSLNLPSSTISLNDPKNDGGKLYNCSPNSKLRNSKEISDLSSVNLTDVSRRTFLSPKSNKLNSSDTNNKKVTNHSVSVESLITSDFHDSNNDIRSQLETPNIIGIDISAVNSESTYLCPTKEKVSLPDDFTLLRPSNNTLCHLGELVEPNELPFQSISSQDNSQNVSNNTETKSLRNSSSVLVNFSCETNEKPVLNNASDLSVSPGSLTNKKLPENNSDVELTCNKRKSSKASEFSSTPVAENTVIKKHYNLRKSSQNVTSQSQPKKGRKSVTFGSNTYKSASSDDHNSELSSKQASPSFNTIMTRSNVKNANLNIEEPNECVFTQPPIPSRRSKGQSQSFVKRSRSKNEEQSSANEESNSLSKRRKLDDKTINELSYDSLDVSVIPKDKTMVQKKLIYHSTPINPVLEKIKNKSSQSRENCITQDGYSDKMIQVTKSGLGSSSEGFTLRSSNKKTDLSTSYSYHPRHLSPELSTSYSTECEGEGSIKRKNISTEKKDSKRKKSVEKSSEPSLQKNSLSKKLSLSTTLPESSKELRGNSSSSQLSSSNGSAPRWTVRFNKKIELRGELFDTDSSIKRCSPSKTISEISDRTYLSGSMISTMSFSSTSQNPINCRESSKKVNFKNSVSFINKLSASTSLSRDYSFPSNQNSITNSRHLTKLTKNSPFSSVNLTKMSLTKNEDQCLSTMYKTSTENTPIDSTSQTISSDCTLLKEFWVPHTLPTSRKDLTLKKNLPTSKTYSDLTLFRKPSSQKYDFKNDPRFFVEGRPYTAPNLKFPDKWVNKELDVYFTNKLKESFPMEASSISGRLISHLCGTVASVKTLNSSDDVQLATLILRKLLSKYSICSNQMEYYSFIMKYTPPDFQRKVLPINGAFENIKTNGDLKFSDCLFSESESIDL